MKIKLQIKEIAISLGNWSSYCRWMNALVKGGWMETAAVGSAGLCSLRAWWAAQALGSALHNGNAKPGKYQLEMLLIRVQQLMCQ